MRLPCEVASRFFYYDPHVDFNLLLADHQLFGLPSLGKSGFLPIHIYSVQLYLLHVTLPSPHYLFAFVLLHFLCQLFQLSQRPFPLYLQYLRPVFDHDHGFRLARPLVTIRPPIAFLGPTPSYSAVLILVLDACPAHYLQRVIVRFVIIDLCMPVAYVGDPNG